MDDNNKIITEVVVDTTAAQQEIIKLNATASDSTKKYEDRVTAKNKATTIQNDLSNKTLAELNKELKMLQKNGASTKDLNKVKKKITATTLKQTKNNANATKSLNKMTDANKKSGAGFALMNSSMGKMISNPIVATIAAIAGVLKLMSSALRGSEESSADLDAAMAGFSQIANIITDTLNKYLAPALKTLVDYMVKYAEPIWRTLSESFDVAKAAIKTLITYFELLATPIKAIIYVAKAAAQALMGDFDGASATMKAFKEDIKATAIELKDNFVETVKQAVEVTKVWTEETENQNNALGESISKAIELSRAESKLIIAKREQKLLNATLNTQISEALQTSKDYTLSTEERSKKIAEAQALEQKRSDTNLALLNREISLVKQQQSLSNNTAEDNEKYNDLLIAREVLQKANADKQRKYLSLEKGLRAEAATDEQKAFEFAAEAADARAADALRKGEDASAAELEAIKLRYQAELAEFDISEADKENLRIKYIDELAQYEFDKKIEEAERTMELDLEIFEEQKSLLEEQGKDTLDIELKILEAAMNQEIKIAEARGKSTVAIKAKYEKASLKLTETSNESKRKSDMATVAAGAVALGDLFGYQKEVQLALSLMALPKALMGIWGSTGSMGPWGVAAAIAQTAIVTVPIIQSISDIASVEVDLPSSSGGGSSSRGGGGGAAASRTPSMVSDLSSVTDIDNLTSGSDQDISDNASSQASSNVQASTSSQVVFSEDSHSSFKNQVEFKEDKVNY